MADVFANNRSILHKGDGNQHVSGPPDVCKTPSPAGPVPIPYPNIAMDSNLAKGAKKVKINGKAVAHEGSNLSTSTGDEAGTAGGGLLSSKFKGKLTWGSSSGDVKVEGKGVARFMDVTEHNGNVWNTVLIAAGSPTGFGYGDDPIDTGPCMVCGEAKSKHRITASHSVLQLVNQIAADIRNGAFAQTLRLPSNHKKLRGKKGVMIGVLVCQCEAEQKYAGLAGGWEDPQWTAVAREFENAAVRADGGFEGHVAFGDPPRPPLSGNFPPVQGPGGNRPPRPFRSMSSLEWVAVQGRVDNAQTQYAGSSNPVLVCAAPKMAQKCLADGHKPGKMVEVYVAMRPQRTILGADGRTGSEGGTIPWRTILTLGPDGKTVPQEVRQTPFADNGEPVPSCTTCQVQMTVMLCRYGQPPCP